MHLFQVVEVIAMRSTSKIKIKEGLLSIPHLNLNRILRKYDKVFEDELTPGLPPKRSAHEIAVVQRCEAADRPLYEML